MKILLSGSFRLSFFRAFKKVCDEVAMFDDEALYKRQSPLCNNRYINRIFWRAFSLPLQKEFIDVVVKTKPDLIMVFKGWFFSPAMLRNIKKMFPHTLLFCFDPDNPFNIWHLGSNNPWITKSIPLYDAYFIWAKFLLDRIKSCGSPYVEYLPFAFDPEIDYPVNPTDEEKSRLASDIVFIGNWDQERESWLRDITDFNLGIWGNNYWLTRCRDSRLRACYKGEAPHGEFSSRVLASSKISLNILRLQNKSSHNLRTFEAPAAGVFVLAEDSPEAKEFFREDREAVYFSSPQELRRKIQYYLNHGQERNAIAQAGYQRCVASGYTYEERTRQILEVYKQLSSVKNSGVRKYKIIFFITHPIPCRVPLYQKISAHNQLDIKLYFNTDKGLKEVYQPEFDHVFKWDLLDLKGVDYGILVTKDAPSVLRRFFMPKFLSIAQEIVRNRYEIVVIPGYGCIFYWQVILGACFSGIPILFLGEPRFPERNISAIKKLFKKTALRFLFSKVKAFGYTGSQAKKFYQSYGVAEAKLFFTPYCANNDFFLEQADKLIPEKEALKTELGIPTGVPVILYLSKVNANKGALDLLRVFKEIRHPAVLIYVGSGPQLSQLKLYARKMAITNVLFFGFQNLSQVPKFYAVADIFVLFSYGESWGLVINEAMCFALPVITTEAVMAAYDLVRHGENGYLIPAGDADALRQALLQLLTREGLRKSMGARSRQLISGWNYDVFIQSLLKACSWIKE